MIWTVSSSLPYHLLSDSDLSTAPFTMLPLHDVPQSSVNPFRCMHQRVNEMPWRIQDASSFR